MKKVNTQTGAANGQQQNFDFSKVEVPAPNTAEVKIDFLVDAVRRLSGQMLFMVALILILMACNAFMLYRLQVAIDQNSSTMNTMDKRSFLLAKDYCAKMYPAGQPVK